MSSAKRPAPFSSASSSTWRTALPLPKREAAEEFDSTAPGRDRGSVDMSFQLRLVKDGGGDFLDRLGRRVERRDVVAFHQMLGFAHFVATVVERRVLAARAALLADLAQPFGLDGEAEQLGAMRQDGGGEPSVGEV